MSIKDSSNLIWIDLEMTGLNPVYHYIIELATIITDRNLNILAEGPVIAINQCNEHLDLMNDWNVRVHTKNGLIERVKTSNFNESKAECTTIDFIKKWVPSNTSPICGNSVAQDRRFLFKYMPKLETYFHYRYLDVSSIKELILRWKPSILSKFKKNITHQALYDIRESIAELNFYKMNFFKIE